MKIAIIGAGHIGVQSSLVWRKDIFTMRKTLLSPIQTLINWRDCKNISLQYT